MLKDGVQLPMLSSGWSPRRGTVSGLAHRHFFLLFFTAIPQLHLRRIRSSETSSRIRALYALDDVRYRPWMSTNAPSAVRVTGCSPMTHVIGDSAP